MSMDFIKMEGSGYGVVAEGLCQIPTCHYLFFFAVFSFYFTYKFFEFHFFEDLCNRIRPAPELLTYHPSSPLYNHVVSKCPTLHTRYFATPWLSNPHMQTSFLNFHGRPPKFSYTREMFRASDGGTMALDWLFTSDVRGSDFDTSKGISKNDTTPIVVIVPGLTSDSYSPYMKHIVFGMAKGGRNVVVSNHRGLGGVSITSDCFYNAGWTEDIRVVFNYLHDEYPEAPLFAVGTSIGANILVKYLGEDGDNTPISGAAAICSPWDLLIGDRFICRKLFQRLYDRVLTIGLKGYAQLHEPLYSRLADWEGIKKSRSIRDFDNYATCAVGKFETVDEYYRRCSSTSFVGTVAVPLLCLSALDDPLCTSEAIPWDECRANKNIVLCTPQHGGHLGMFEGIFASSLWWVRAVDEFLSVLNSSSHMHIRKKAEKPASRPSIDQGPYVNIAEDGMVSAACNEQANRASTEGATNIHTTQDNESSNDMTSNARHDNRERKVKFITNPETLEESPRASDSQPSQDGVCAPVRRCLDEVSRHNRFSLWLLAYISITTTWPLLGSALRFVFGRRK